MNLDLLGNRQRTHYCGELRQAHAGETVFLCGWVARRRDLGNLIFLDLRDHTGVTQVVCRPEVSTEAHDKAEEARAEYVVGVEGEVVLRAPETVNPQLSTGEVEVVAKTLLVLNEAKTPPFPIDDDLRTTEETRLRYRYLDLRRGRMQHHLRLRHAASLAVRQHMSAHGFVEIETPFMTRSTPEGARDYLVPSRIYPGRFYALPQSPQLFKQILMIGGFDRYFQVVRCFRDEDFRADRQAEFTQIDVEMAFPQREMLFEIIEELMVKVFALIEVKVERPFPLLAYDVAMERYGSDKPHLGFDLGWKRVILTERARDQIHVAEPLKALRVPGWATASRSQLDKLQEHAKKSGADWFSYAKVGASEVQSPLTKIIGDESIQTVAAAVNAVAGDLIVMLGLKSASSAGLETLPIHRVRHLDEASGEVRLDVARKLDLIKPGTWNFAWVVDFPMFDYDEKEKRFNPMHHPFTSPRDEDLERLESDPASVKARAYDLVLNGSEIGGGSVRIHRQDVQKRIFDIIGLTEEKAKERFGFFLDALEYGTPPHGGIALGYDRIIALMAGESNIREVIAFPKTASAADLMCDAPSPVDGPQEEELELMAAFPGLPPQCWELAGLCDRLLETVDADVFSKRIPEGGHFLQSISLIVSKVKGDARAAVKLAKAGYGRQAVGLARSLVEAAINSEYIQADPERRGTAFLGSIKQEMERFAKRLVPHGISEEIERAMRGAIPQEANAIQGKSDWPPDVRSRAYAADKTRYIYDAVYIMLLKLLHCSVFSLADQLEEAADWNWTVRVGRGPDWVEQALVTVFTSFLRVADVAYSAFGLDKANLEKLYNEFEDRLRSQVGKVNPAAM